MTLNGILAQIKLYQFHKKPGSNNLALIGYSTLANNALTGIWAANPGAGAVIVVSVKR